MNSFTPSWLGSSDASVDNLTENPDLQSVQYAGRWRSTRLLAFLFQTCVGGEGGVRNTLI